jgi:predicted nuclease of predicted toxin-antitoxin system
MGHDVHTVLAEQLGGNPDPHVFGASQVEERVLVTFDLDFSDIRVYPSANHHGIWVCVPTHKVSRILALLRSASRVLKDEPVQRQLWIIEPERVRIHE